MRFQPNKQVPVALMLRQAPTPDLVSKGLGRKIGKVNRNDTFGLRRALWQRLFSAIRKGLSCLYELDAISPFVFDVKVSIIVPSYIDFTA